MMKNIRRKAGAAAAAGIEAIVGLMVTAPSAQRGRKLLSIWVRSYQPARLHLRRPLPSGRGPLPGIARPDAGDLGRHGDLGAAPLLPSAWGEFAGLRA